MLSSICALVLFLPPATAGGEGSLAPDLGLPDSAESGWAGWIEPTAADGVVERRVSKQSGRPGERAGTLGPEERGGIVAYHGVPLVLHTFAFDDTTSTAVVLPLMRDLAEANVDRGIGVLGVAHGTSDEALESELAALKQLGVTYPVARVDLTKAGGPYLDLTANGLAFACVIGPNGALLWRGNPAEDERDFLAAVQAAYARTVVAPLARALAPELEKATVAYLAAELKDARAKAEKLASSKDAAVAADAALLVELVERTRAGWLADARAHGASGPDLRYFEVASAIRTALARTDAVGELDELEREIKKKPFWRLRGQDLEGWRELRVERPAAFPARADKAGDAFAKKLEKLGRSTVNSNEATQAVEDLLARYAGMKARD